MRPLHLQGRVLISHLQGSGLEAERGRGAGELARLIQCLLGKLEDKSLGSQNRCKKPKVGSVATVSVVSASRRQNPFKAGDLDKMELIS